MASAQRRLLGREDGCSCGDSHHSVSLALKPRQKLVEKGMFKEEKFSFVTGLSQEVRCPWGERSPWHCTARSTGRGKASLELQRKLPRQRFPGP